MSIAHYPPSEIDFSTFSETDGQPMAEQARAAAARIAQLEAAPRAAGAAQSPP